MIPVNDPELLIGYTEKIVEMISEKYGFDPLVSLQKFWDSKAYAMLKDPELLMIEFEPFAIFDMWEVEQLTGEPRDSIHLRS